VTRYAGFPRATVAEPERTFRGARGEARSAGGRLIFLPPSSLPPSFSPPLYLYPPPSLARSTAGCVTRGPLVVPRIETSSLAHNSQVLTSRRHFRRGSGRGSGHLEFISTNRVGYFCSYFFFFFLSSSFSTTFSALSPIASGSVVSFLLSSLFPIPSSTFFHVLEDVAAGVHVRRQTDAHSSYTRGPHSRKQARIDSATGCIGRASRGRESWDGRVRDGGRGG